MTVDTLTDTWPVSHHIATLRYHLPELSRQYNIKTLGIFGSYTRNEQTPLSDLDVLVEFDTIPNLFTYIEIQETLTLLTGVQVDLVHRPDLKPYMKAYILDEVVMV